MDVKECTDCKKGFYSFIVKVDTQTHIFSSDKSKSQESWIEALIQAGASFLEVN